MGLCLERERRQTHYAEVPGLVRGTETISCGQRRAFSVQKYVPVRALCFIIFLKYAYIPFQLKFL